MTHESDALTRPWRRGRSVGRTIYLQKDADPAKGDELIGVMDTPYLAGLVITAMHFYQKKLADEVDAVEES